MNQRIFWISAILQVFSVAALYSQVPSAPGWYQLPNTKMTAVCEDGPGTCANVINAWNSGVFDTKRNRLIIWGGGHNDYYGNEIYALNLSGTPAFERINNSTAGGCSQESCDGGLTPNSRHTYDGIEYLPVQDKMFVFGGSRGGNGYFLNGTWTFDFATKTWKLMSPAGTNPSASVSISAYDSNTKLVFLSDLSDFYSYNYSTNTYQRRGSSSGNVGYWSNAAIDPKRKKFVVFGGGEASFYDISGTGSYDRQAFATTGGSAVVSEGYPGLVYDPVRDRMVAYCGGNLVYTLDMDTRVWTTHNYPGNPGANPAAGTYGRWNYSPALDVFVIVNSINIDAHTFRFPATSIRSAPQAEPGALQVALYPNPAGLQSALHFSSPLKRAEIELYEISGKRIWRIQGAAGSRVSWKAGMAGSGLYILKVRTAGRYYIRKLLVD